MSLLLRLIDISPKALAAFEEDKPLPAAYLREFCPSERDKGGLSVFEVSDENQALDIAAAFALTFSEKPNKAMMFAKLPRGKLTPVWTTLSTGKSKFGISHVDEMHREIYVSDTQQSVTIARLFFSEEPIFCEGKLVGEALRRIAHSNKIQFDGLCVNRSYSENIPARHLVRFVGEKVLEPQGKKAGPGV